MEVERCKGITGRAGIEGGREGERDGGGEG